MTEVYRDRLFAEDVAVGDTGPELVVSDLTREDFVRYAGASGDFSRSHYDEPFVIQEQDDPAVYAQGMLTMAIGSHMIADWFGLEAINRYRMRFSSRVWPGATLIVSGEVTDIRPSEDGTGADVDADLVVRNDEGEKKATGDTTARLPSRNGTS